MTNILIVDDEVKIRDLIEIYLRREGLNVLQASNGIEALNILETTKIDLMIVDVMMPQMNGFELVESLRKSKYDIPILMMTAKGELQDKKQGFESGVDDYMVKPLDVEELVYRVKALLKRANISFSKQIVIDDITLYYESLEVQINNRSSFLPQKEFYLLYKLLSYPNIIFTRQELMDEIWGYDSEADERTVDVHIKRLRDRFKDHPQFEIITIRGLGYKGVY